MMHWIRGDRLIKMFYSKVIPVLWATRTSNESWRRKPSRHTHKNCMNLPARCTKYPHKSFDSALLLMKCFAEAKKSSHKTTQFDKMPHTEASCSYFTHSAGLFTLTESHNLLHLIGCIWNGFFNRKSAYDFRCCDVKSINSVRSM